MNGKPKSGRGLRLTAWHCTYPDLDGIDKGLLAYLADYATATGGDSHPGNKNIADAIGLKDRAADNRLAKNIGRGLVERTLRADGRGKASVYRLCLSSPYFPDQTPGGEWLIEKPRSEECADSTETAKPSIVNRAVEAPKPRSQQPETAQLKTETAQPEVPTNNYSSNTQQLHTNNTGETAQQENSDWEEAVGRLFFDHNKTSLRLRRKDREQFLAAIQQHGKVAVMLAWEQYVLVGNYNDKTTCPAWPFFDKGSAENFIRDAKLKMNSQEWKDKQDPNYAEKLEASIRRQAAENWKWFSAPGPTLCLETDLGLLELTEINEKKD